MKIAVYAISKNEEKFVKQFCESAKGADLILIADTGSTDRTKEIAQECGAQVVDICITPWRFDRARDAALALVPKDYDICISLDLDELLEPGWRAEVERVWTPETTRMRYKFDWSQGIVFFSEKIHARHGYSWHHPCHEYPRPDSRIREVYANSEMLLVTHHPDPEKSRGQYLPLLEMSVQEDPHCPRNAFYYARELVFYNQYEKAIAALDKYLGMPEATWVNDRAYAMRLKGRCYKELGNKELAYKWFRLACAEKPDARENWVDLAQFAYENNDWTECFSSASHALAITHRELVYTADPVVWGAKPHDLLAIAAYRLGYKDISIQHGTLAVELDQQNERLIKNLEFYKE